jgi:tripartite-type tricarboxylate transporter receptor subunit TctC
VEDVRNYFQRFPTIGEAGNAGHEVSFWTGLMTPKTTPQEIIDQLNKQVRDVLWCCLESETLERIERQLADLALAIATRAVIEAILYVTGNIE